MIGHDYANMRNKLLYVKHLTLNPSPEGEGLLKSLAGGTPLLPGEKGLGDEVDMQPCDLFLA